MKISELKEFVESSAVKAHMPKIEFIDKLQLAVIFDKRMLKQLDKIKEIFSKEEQYNS